MITLRQAANIVGKMSRKAEREAWTQFVDGTKSTPTDAPSKYFNERAGKYASKHEADTAGKLAALQQAGMISELKEQVRIILVPGQPPLKPILYIADFTYIDAVGKFHVLDSKGFKTQVYRLKKRLAALLLNIEIEED